MIQIYIGNRLATLKRGMSFDYVSENRLFSGADGYSLSISFPLRGCPANLEIFGNINRADVTARKVIYDCDIICPQFTKSGVITITGITDSEVKAQFMEGRTVRNFDVTFDDLYINELSLGAPSASELDPVQTSPAVAWGMDATTYVARALPWVNNNSESGNLQNRADLNIFNMEWEWHEDTKKTKLSWQLYLAELIRRICTCPEVGFTCDLGALTSDPRYNRLIVCNALPGAWERPEYAAALPRWTVTEFFEKLELFLDVDFDVDHKARHVTCRKRQFSNGPRVTLERVVDELSTEVKVEDADCDYIEGKNHSYKDCDFKCWKYYSCKWLIDQNPDLIITYPTLSALLAALKNNTVSLPSRVTKEMRIYYAADVDAYFAFEAVDRKEYTRNISPEGQDPFLIKYYRYSYDLRMLNAFGGRIVDPVDDDAEEIDIVPASVMYTDSDHGFCCFMDPGNLEDTTTTDYDQEVSNAITSSDEGIDLTGTEFHKTLPFNLLESGQSEDQQEYLDRIYIGYYDYNPDADFYLVSQSYAGSDEVFTRKQMPHAHAFDIVIKGLDSYVQLPFSLRLNSSIVNAARAPFMVDKTRKYTFKFLADRLPDVSSIFYIRGKRYLCEKLTATVTEAGMSELIKGVFWPITD